MDKRESCGIIIPVRDGYVDCPYCGAGRLLRVRPETTASALQIYCRRCKREMIVNIDKGQCFESRGR